MVTTLAEQFRQAHLRIGIERANAIAAHVEVRARLETDAKLIEWGVDTVLIGSYARKVAIYPCHDVDVFVKLPKCPPNSSPEAVFSEVQRVLVEAYGNRASEQRRSIKIDGFAGELSVDVVPAVPESDHWKIPQTDTAPVGGRWIKDRWEETNPERLSGLADASQRAGSTIDGEPSYRRTVRLIRQVRDANLGDTKPGGLYFELLTYWAFQAGSVAAASYAEQLAQVLGIVAGQLASGSVVIEPGMMRPYDPAPTASERATAADVFGQLATAATGALTLEECAAAAVWRRILGQNPRGWCFPIPPNCTATGQRIAPLPHRDRGPDVERPFA